MNQSNKLQIQCSSIALKKEELLAIIPNEVKQQLSVFDKDYESKLKPYTLCHEGDAKPSVFEGNSRKSVIMRWTKDTVRGFISKLKTGLQFFDGHNPTNDNQSNKVLGTLVAFGEKLINGVTSAVGVGYFPNPNNDMDVISAEFDVLTEGLIDNGSFISVVSSAIGEITGLALGSRKAGMKPAFPNAESLFVQAFEFIPNEENKNGEKILTKEEILGSLTSEDVRRLVKEREWRPTQLFDAGNIFKIDENEDGSRRIKSSDDSLNKWFKDNLKEAVILPKTKIETFRELESKYTNLEKSHTDAKPYFVKSKANEAFSEVSKKHNLEQNEKKLAFVKGNVEKNLDKFNGDISLLNKHIESEVENYSTIFEEAIKSINQNGFQPLSAGSPAAHNAVIPNNDKYTL
jgi:hypothetical protein